MPPLQTLALILLCTAAEQAPQISPVPPAVLREVVAEWTFDQDTQEWLAEQHCDVTAEGGLLKILATQADPYMHRKVDLPGGRMLLQMRARSRNSGPGSVYWTTRESPSRGEDKSKHFPLVHDGQWHEVSADFTAPGRLTDLRIDPGATAGEFEIDWIRLARQEVHPLTIEDVEVADDRVRFLVKTHLPQPVEFSAFGRTYVVPAEGTVEVEGPIRGDSPLEAVTCAPKVPGFPLLKRTVFLHHAEAQTDWIVRPLGEFSLQIARDGTVGRIRRGDALVAVLAPLVHCDGKLPALKLVEEAATLRFEGEGVRLAVSAEGSEISVSIAGPVSCEGPVVRALGGLEQGLFAGLEYLGRGEKSSSKLDVETEEHLRFVPDPLKVTMPLMAFVTDRASLAMTWTDMGLQPVFATPNAFDATDDHRMALRGGKIEAVIRVDGLPLEEAIDWAVRRHGLPPLPQPPRSPEEQWTLCLAALNGPLKNDSGWGHCVEDRWPRQPYADIASTVWRLTGQVPELPRLVPGGSHVRNESIYFVSGRAAE